MGTVGTKPVRCSQFDADQASVLVCSNGDHSLATGDYLFFQHFTDNPTPPVIELARHACKNYERVDPTFDGETYRAVGDRQADPLGQEGRARSALA
jgi:hypothetical protein